MKIGLIEYCGANAELKNKGERFFSKRSPRHKAFSLVIITLLL